MQSKHHFKLGLFVCFVIFLSIGILIFLGILDQFNDKAVVTTFFSESVQGLTKGSGVKLLGVPIGRVKDISFEAETRLIRIDMEIDLSKIHIRDSADHTKGSDHMTTDQFYILAQRAITEDSLRAKLASEGITGVKFVQLDYHLNDKTEPLFPPGWNKEHDIFYVPAVPSLLRNLESSITGILDKLNEVDYKGISNHVVRTLNATDKLVADPNIPRIIANVEAATAELSVTAKTLNNNVTQEQIQNLISKANHLMASYQQLATVMEQEVKSMKMEDTTGKVRNSLDSFSRSNARFVESMQKINDGIDALIELIQTLENNPSSVIYGKKNMDNVEGNHE